MPFLAEMRNRQYSIPGGMADRSATQEEANAQVDGGSPHKSSPIVLRGHSQMSSRDQLTLYQERRKYKQNE